MPDYEDYTQVVLGLSEAQGAEKDNREKAREAHDFLSKRNGQWETDVWDKRNGQPRYTFDKTNPVVNQIAGEIKKADFDIKVRPSGGEASKESAKLLDGIIRNIETISNASIIYNRAARNMIAGGADGWMIVQDWADTDAFDQDLFIKPVPNFWDCVWFDTNSQEQDRSDAMWAHRLSAMSAKAYEHKYPEGSGMSVSQDKQNSSYWYKPDQVIVGEFYYIEMKNKTLVQMSDGSVYVDDEKFQSVADELAEQGITEKGRRKRPSRTCYVRHYDGEGWLDEAKETVFSWIPLIPTYGNFNIVDNKIIYHGVVEKLLDSQRVHNYVMSRYVGEVALSPKEKIWMTREQSKGNEKTLRTMNTNNDPVQFYDHTEGHLPPFRPGGAQPSPALESLAALTTQSITQASGLFSSSMGDNQSLQSGVAISQLQERGDTGTIDYFQSQEVAICHTARILINAIPKVYDARRQIRILNEDGSFDMQMLNESVVDQETGQVVILNDLSKGRYDVTCDVGKSFKNRQQESVAAILEIAQIDPSVVQQGGDVLLNSTNAPGLDVIAERKRQQLMGAGLIPQSQWTEEEAQQVQQAKEQAAQNPQPDAAMLLAQAEMTKAQADMMEAQLKQQEMQLRGAELQQKQQQMDYQAQAKSIELQQSGQKDSISAAQKQQEFDLKIQQMQQDLALKIEENDRKNAQAMNDISLGQQEFIKMQAETLNVIKSAMGADVIIGPSNTAAYENQAGSIADSTSDDQA